MTPTSFAEGITGPALPVHLQPLQDCALHLYLATRAARIERDGATVIYRLQGSFFVVDEDRQQVWGPYPELATLFGHHGRLVSGGAGGRILEWAGLIVSQDSQGSVSGPYPSLDDWIWSEGRTVPHPRRDLDLAPILGGRYVHEWGGLYFVTVDPLPVAPHPFPSLAAAVGHLRGMPLHRTRFPAAS